MEQRRRFAVQQAERDVAGDQEVPLPDENYCRALEYGLPPTAGWGLGVDRLVALLTQSRNIRETMAFPIVKPTHAPIKTP
jgi:lysyl-tRNA synthetase class 2